MQTPIDFLVSKIASKIDDKYYSNQQDITEYVEQAKEMEKQQIETAYEEGETFPQGYLHSKDYYKKNYGNYTPPKEVNNVSFGEISDEDIDKEAELYQFTDGVNSFKFAIQWYREQLKQL